MKRRLPPENRCVTCKKLIQQPTTGRTRLYCSRACRQKRFRARHGRTSRLYYKKKKLYERQRALPFIERSFDEKFYMPVLVLSFRRHVYECMACGTPFIVERLRNGNPPPKYCSVACEKKSKYHWRRFGDAFERALQTGRRNDTVEERLDLGRLSPLCPRCGIPFPPNSRQRGRPRKYCSDACRKAAYERRWKTKHKRARVHRFRQCAGCGATFDRTDGLGRRRMRFCSEACKARVMSRTYRVRRAKRQPGLQRRR